MGQMELTKTPTFFGGELLLGGGGASSPSGSSKSPSHDVNCCTTEAITFLADAVLVAPGSITATCPPLAAINVFNWANNAVWSGVLTLANSKAVGI